MRDGAPRRSPVDGRQVLAAIEALGADLDRKFNERIERLEDWRLVSDGPKPGGLPLRMTDLEDATTEQRGAVKGLRAALWVAVTVLGILTGALALLQRGGS